jgi:DNA-binding transcriptional MerR regulator
VNEPDPTNGTRASERGYLSIGEVLLLLQDEFPDVTISKIRFLESQGLIEPERTPSGYRKFFDTDVERLRYILREQKDHYLPLRVIKHRLDTEPTGPLSRLLDPTDPQGMDTPDGPDPADDAPGGGDGSHNGTRPIGDPEDETRGAARSAPRDDDDDPEEAGAAGSSRSGGTEQLLGADELRRHTGLSATELRELEQYGIVSSRLVSGEVLYPPEEVEVARTTVTFLRRGVEPRHLRMYRQAVEREVSLFEQMVVPYLKQRNPHARKLAEETLEALADAGGALRAALVRHRLRDLLEG